MNSTESRRMDGAPELFKKSLRKCECWKTLLTLWPNKNSVNSRKTCKNQSKLSLSTTKKQCTKGRSSWQEDGARQLHFLLIYLFYLTIFYWLCHTLTWIRNRCTDVPHPEPPSHLPPHPIAPGHPSAPAPRHQGHASNLDWRFISHIIYKFQCHSPILSRPCPLPESKRLFNTSVSLFLSCI